MPERMKSLAAYVAHILALEGREARRRALQKVPPHRRGEVERLVKPLWGHRERVRQEKAKRSGIGECIGSNPAPDRKQPGSAEAALSIIAATRRNQPMWNIAISVIFNAVRWLVGSGVLARIYEHVERLDGKAQHGAAGDHYRRPAFNEVWESLRGDPEIREEINALVQRKGRFLINLAIEAAVARLRG